MSGGFNEVVAAWGIRIGGSVSLSRDFNTQVMCAC